MVGQDRGNSVATVLNACNGPSLSCASPRPSVNRQPTLGSAVGTQIPSSCCPHPIMQLPSHTKSKRLCRSILIRHIRRRPPGPASARHMPPWILLVVAMTLPSVRSNHMRSHGPFRDKFGLSFHEEASPKRWSHADPSSMANRKRSRPLPHSRLDMPSHHAQVEPGWQKFLSCMIRDDVSSNARAVG